MLVLVMEEIRAIEIALTILGEKWLEEESIYGYEVIRHEDAPVVDHVVFFRVLAKDDLEAKLKSVGNSYSLFDSVGYTYDRIGEWEQLFFFTRQEIASTYYQKRIGYGAN